eukprot:1157374-Pelagomonas_calceolata.AAC.6
MHLGDELAVVGGAQACCLVPGGARRNLGRGSSQQCCSRCSVYKLRRGAVEKRGWSAGAADAAALLHAATHAAHAVQVAPAGLHTAAARGHGGGIAERKGEALLLLTLVGLVRCLGGPAQKCELLVVNADAPVLASVLLLLALEG